MSRSRGIFPLFLATTFGIINGVWIFGPAFKEQQVIKDEQARKVLQISHASESEVAEEKALRNVESAASRSPTTESTSKPASSNSWGPYMSLWSRGSTTPSENTQEKPVDKNTKG